MSPPRKYPVPNQDINRLITQQDPSIPPIMEKYTTGYKALFNDTHEPYSTEDNHDNSRDDSRNENEDSVNKLKVNNNDDNDDEYKDENSAALKNDESVINKTEEEEALIERLMSMDFPLKFLSYVIGTISSYKQKMI